MKKISLLFLGVLFCTLVFANETVDPIAPTSSVAVTNATGSSLFKLYYTANVADNVKVSIVNSNGKIVFTETIKKVKGFVRPYNFNNLDEGKYAIQIENAVGKKSETIYYGAENINKLVNVVKLSDPGKYLFTVKSQFADNIDINIYDSNDQLIHSQSKFVDKEFAEVFNLKSVNSFTIEVIDKNGLVKSMKYDN